MRFLNAITGNINSSNYALSAMNADKFENQHGSYYLNYSNHTNKPTSLPANGGNSDTVDNKHASDFYQIQTTVITTQDWNTLKSSGVYEVTNFSGPNAPPNTYPYGNLMVNQNGMEISQIYHSYSTNQISIRSHYDDGGAWGAWRELTPTYSQTDLIAGSSALASGSVYYVFE